MKNYIKLTLISLTIISCNNRDVIIQNSKTTCGFGEIGHYDQVPYDYDYYNSNNKYDSGLDKTNSIELKNNSETKVYKVLIQINTDGKITYAEYVIQPTETLDLGCDRDFDVSISNYNEYNGKNLSLPLAYNLSKYRIHYKIHKVETVSEY